MHMVLTDWEIIMGGELVLSDKYKVSGNKSLSQNIDGGATHMVHKATYDDAPKNVEIRTWMTHDDIWYNKAHFFIGIIARKQSGANTYFYGLLDFLLDTGGEIDQVLFDAGYYIDGSQTSIGSQDITNAVTHVIGGTWSNYYWVYVRMLAYELSDQFNIVFEVSPDIESPDVNNPPLDQLSGVASATIDIPTELQNGGACGIIVGNAKAASDTDHCYPYYDYTQIFY